MQQIAPEMLAVTQTESPEFLKRKHAVNFLDKSLFNRMKEITLKYIQKTDKTPDIDLSEYILEL